MIVIPSGKELILKQGGAPVTGAAKIILEEEVTINLSSSFDKLVNKDTSALNLVGGVLRTLTGKGGSGQFAQFGLQVWKGTEPITMSITASFHLGDQGIWDAKTEVISPAMSLCKLPLPSTGGYGGTLIGPGPSVLTAVGIEEKNSSYKPIFLKVAKYLTISQVVITKAQPTFSTEVDEKGYPIWAKVQIDITSIETATVEMLKTGSGSIKRRNSFREGIL